MAVSNVPSRQIFWTDAEHLQKVNFLIAYALWVILTAVSQVFSSTKSTANDSHFQAAKEGTTGDVPENAQTIGIDPFQRSDQRLAELQRRLQG